MRRDNQKSQSLQTSPVNSPSHLLQPLPPVFLFLATTSDIGQVARTRSPYSLHLTTHGGGTASLFTSLCELLLPSLCQGHPLRSLVLLPGRSCHQISPSPFLSSCLSAPPPPHIGYRCGLGLTVNAVGQSLMFCTHHTEKKKKNIKNA